MEARKWLAVAGPYLVGISAFLILGGYIYALQSAGKSAAALAMSPDMDMRDMKTFGAFPFLQSSGLIALLFAFFSVLLGLYQGERKASGAAASIPAGNLHRHISLCVVALVLTHMLTTALDGMGDSWKTVLVPGAWAEKGWPEAVLGYNLGIASAYLLVLLAPTYYARQHFSPNNWRFLHRLILIFYSLAVWHAMILGLDLAHYEWLRPFIWLAQIPLLLLLMKRLSGPFSSKSGAGSADLSASRISCAILFLICGAAVIGLVMIVMLGKSGFIDVV
jgi:hypothetical protein